jgi:dsDNA-binding SOS-regulon protein
VVLIALTLIQSQQAHIITKPTNQELKGCLLGVELAANYCAIRFEWVVIFAVTLNEDLKMSFEIKKEALEKAMQEMINEVEKADDWFQDEKITIHCGNNYEVQILVTNDEDQFLGTILGKYAKAI